MQLKIRIMHIPGMMVVNARKTESADAMLSFERSQFRKLLSIDLNFSKGSLGYIAFCALFLTLFSSLL